MEGRLAGEERPAAVWGRARGSSAGVDGVPCEEWVGRPR